jgi:hypothetical protein
MKSVKLPLFLAISIVVLQACYCTSIPNVVCQRPDGSTYVWGMDDLWGHDECGDNGDTQIGTTYGNPTPAPPTNPLGNGNGTNNIVGNSGFGLNCNTLVLTSPSGLPNGTTTFYWDGVQGAVAYRINIYDNNGNYLTTFDSQGATTNLTADVSWGAIGGQYDLQVEIVAFGGGTSCSRTFNIQREAPSGGVPSGGGGGNGGGAPAPTSTPTCAEFPRPDCIH